MKKVIFACLMCSFLTSVSALGQQKALIAEQWNVMEFRTIIGEQDFLDCRTYAYVLADDTIINNTNYQTIYRQKACDSLNTSELEFVGAFYFPLNQEWKFLKEMYCDEGPKTEIEVITFDSTLVIAGKTYYSFRKFYFRSEGNKVFYHVSDDMPDVVLYDFDLQVGDSLTFFEEALPWYMIDPENPTYTVVTSIDTVTLMDGRQARRIHYDNRVDDIEYVGSVKGLLEPLRLPIATCMNISLLCVNINGEPIYAPSPDTAIPELLINTQSSKVFEDGQLIIINNGIRYNATGARVK